MYLAVSATFLLLRLAKGDAYGSYAESSVSPELVQRMREAAGYKQSFATQYVKYVGLAARGDFGYSMSAHEPVLTVIRRAIPNTAWLMFAALLTSVVGGMALGAWQGAHVGSSRERATNALVLLAFSTPEFWLATMCALVFGTWLGWLPLSGMTTLGGTEPGVIPHIVDVARHALMPWFVLSVFGLAIFARYQRGAMREVIGEPFVQTARAKGVRARDVMRRHALRVAMLPVLTVVGLWVPALIGGAVFVETVFSWPGMGRLLVDGIAKRDYDLVQGCVVVGSLLTVAGSLLADVLREFADPRLRG
jgi:peptide/nickel transport system permease protein